MKFSENENVDVSHQKKIQQKNQIFLPFFWPRKQSKLIKKLKKIVKSIILSLLNYLINLDCILKIQKIA